MVIVEYKGGVDEVRADKWNLEKGVLVFYVEDGRGYYNFWRAYKKWIRFYVK